MTDKFQETMTIESDFTNEMILEDIPDDALQDINENDFVENNLTGDVDDNDASTSIVSKYLRDIASYSLLKDEDFDILIRKAKAGDNEAYNKIVLHNLRLVVSVVKRYLNIESSLSMMDLIMEGNFGLFKAIDHFDPDRGYKFSTYAYHWIRQCVSRAIYDSGSMIRIPVHANESLYKYRRCISNWQQTTGSDEQPPKEYVMQQMSLLTDEQYYALIHAYELSTMDSLNRTISINTDDTSELIDFVTDDTVDISANIENEELARIIDETIERFIAKNNHNPERIKDILRRRFGLHGYEPQTLDIIGKYYGITRERVRQIEAHFMKFCRTGYTCAKLRRYWKD